jgi:hypothetical protein
MGKLDQIKPLGNRSDIVLVDSLRFGMVTRRAWDQSTYSEESSFSQKARSSASVL